MMLCSYISMKPLEFTTTSITPMSNLNNLVPGTELKAKPGRDHATPRGTSNNAAQVWNHNLLLELPGASRRSTN
jgi:hypothetical protein